MSLVCCCLYRSKRDSWMILSLSKSRSALATPRQMCFGALGCSRGKGAVRLWAETLGGVQGRGEVSVKQAGLSKCPRSPSRVLSSRNKGHWSWDVDLFFMKYVSYNAENFLCCIPWFPFNVSLGQPVFGKESGIVLLTPSFHMSNLYADTNDCTNS